MSDILKSLKKKSGALTKRFAETYAGNVELELSNKQIRELYESRTRHLDSSIYRDDYYKTHTGKLSRKDAAELKTFYDTLNKQGKEILISAWATGVNKDFVKYGAYDETGAIKTEIGETLRLFKGSKAHRNTKEGLAEQITLERMYARRGVHKDIIDSMKQGRTYTAGTSTSYFDQVGPDRESQHVKGTFIETRFGGLKSDKEGNLIFNTTDVTTGKTTTIKSSQLLVVNAGLTIAMEGIIKTSKFWEKQDAIKAKSTARLKESWKIIKKLETALNREKAKYEKEMVLNKNLLSQKEFKKLQKEHAQTWENKGASVAAETKDPRLTKYETELAKMNQEIKEKEIAKNIVTKAGLNPNTALSESEKLMLRKNYSEEELLLENSSLAFQVF